MPEVFYWSMTNQMAAAKEGWVLQTDEGLLFKKYVAILPVGNPTLDDAAENHFATQWDGWYHITTSALNGSSLHIKALAMIKKTNLGFYTAIITVFEITYIGDFV